MIALTTRLNERDDTIL